MNNKDNEWKNNQDVQATSDEAARLLQELERGTRSPKQQPIPPSTPNDSVSPLGGCLTLVGLMGLISLIGLAGQIEQSSTRQTADSSSVGQSKNESKNIDKTPRQKVTISGAQKNFYYKTLAKADQAVLKREHENAIRDLNMLKVAPYIRFKEVNQRLVRDKITAANKKIKFLDQPGKYKYWESTDYGYQWFDKNNDTGFRVFFAYSRRCKKPLITFQFSKTDNGPVLERYKVTPRKNTSTIEIPYKLDGYQYLGIEGFKCNEGRT